MSKERLPSEIVGEWLDDTKEFSNVLALLRKKEWLGDAELFPELQTQLDGLADSVDRLCQQYRGYVEKCKETEKYIGQGNHTKGLELDRILQLMSADISRTYSTISSAMGSLSHDLYIRDLAQYAMEKDSEGREQLAPRKLIEEVREAKKSEREMVDSMYDQMAIDEKNNDSNEIETDEKTQKDIDLEPFYEWTGSFSKLDKINGALLKDKKGFKDVVKSTGLPMECRLAAACITFIDNVGLMQFMAEKFLKISRVGNKGK